MFIQVRSPVKGTVAFVDADEGDANAVVNVKGIDIILTAKRKAFHLRRQFTELGLNPEARQIVAIKIGYLEPELKAMAAEAYLALSPGAVNLDFKSLPFGRVKRPLYPLDEAMDWTPQVEVWD